MRIILAISILWMVSGCGSSHGARGGSSCSSDCGRQYTQPDKVRQCRAMCK